MADESTHRAILAIAEAVAPDEVDLAPTMLDAYLAGGRDRKDLFHTASGPTVAGFGGTEGLMLVPTVLASLATAATIVGPALADLLTPTSDALKCMTSLFELRKVRSVPTDEVRSIVSSEVPAVGPTLMQVIDVVESQLEAEGLDEERRSAVTLGCVKALLSAGPEGQGLIAELGRAGR